MIEKYSLWSTIRKTKTVVTLSVWALFVLLLLDDGSIDLFSLISLFYIIDKVNCIGMSETDI